MDKIRNGSFTSSEIVALMKDGKAAGTMGAPALLYIKQTNWERKLGRSLDKEVSTRPMAWGKLCEYVAFDLLGMEYRHCSQDTLQHPEIEYWVGSPDGEKLTDEGKTVIDFKCPELAAFCELSEIETGEDLKKIEPKYYWQLVSNACITGAKFAELIIFCPYQSQLQGIREMVNDENVVPIDKIYQFLWINNANDEEMVYLPNEGSQYKNIKIIRFEVSEIDKANLTNRVLSAGKLLIPRT